MRPETFIVAVILLTLVMLCTNSEAQNFPFHTPILEQEFVLFFDQADAITVSEMSGKRREHMASLVKEGKAIVLGIGFLTYRKRIYETKNKEYRVFEATVGTATVYVVTNYRSGIDI